MAHLNSDPVNAAVEHLRHLLPLQGPIEIFIHHNTLHSFEHLHFEDAVERAAEIYNAHPYLGEEEYRELYCDNKIRESDIEHELRPFLADDFEIVPKRLTRAALRRALMFTGLTHEHEVAARWKQSESRLRLRTDVPKRLRRTLIEETRLWLLSLRGSGKDALLTELQSHSNIPLQLARRDLDNFIRADNRSQRGRRKSDQVTASLLWHMARARAHELPLAPPPGSFFHREALQLLSGRDIYAMVNPLLIQLCSMFTDQGVSHWPMPGRDLGLLQATEQLFLCRGIPVDPWVRRFESLCRELRPSQTGAHDIIRSVLVRLGVPESQFAEFILQTGLNLKGWAGFIALAESRPQSTHERPIRAALIDFVAVQSLCLAAAIEQICVDDGIPGPTLDILLSRAQPLRAERHAEEERRTLTQLLFEVCQITGIPPQELAEHGAALARTIVSEVSSFSGTVRRRIWHLAYERTFLESVLVAFRNHAPKPRGGSSRIEAQVVFCIDEREESMRRHLEELNSHIETLGYPGFFSLALAYRGVHQLHPEALCPVALQPVIAVEQIDETVRSPKTQSLFQRCIGYINREIHNVTRTPLGGSLLSATVGHFALVPFMLRVLQPALAGRVHEALHVPGIKKAGFVLRTANPNQSDAELKAHIVEGLRSVFVTIGLAARFAPLVVIMGHGSSSLNNPHESAHDCGACGGRRGAPNAQLFARFANDPDVRSALRKVGVDLPASTYVVGLYHDTCDDSIALFDEELIPASHRGLVSKILRDCETASARNALERSRRFLSSPLHQSPRQAATSMLHRAEDFAEPRPEYGHATNALAFVGRRERCRGLFLDRRAFLSSYDSSHDRDGAILEALLSAIVPVCAGINLEYYFSMVDSSCYGCGTKLPHNIVGQIGVMDGTASDLRTGLPWQMVEIHEPVRLVMLVESSPETLARVLDHLPGIRGLVERRWLRLISLAPDSQEFYLFGPEGFSQYAVDERPIPAVTDSIAYCSRTTSALPFASVIGGHQ